jgi:hypothetical protein
MFMPEDFAAERGAGDETAGVRCTVPALFFVADALDDGSPMRITFRAVSSASSSAGSLGLDTFEGSLLAVAS